MRLKNKFTPDDNLRWSASQATDWRNVLIETLWDSLFCPKNLSWIGVDRSTDGDDSDEDESLATQDDTCQKIFDLSMHIVDRRC